MATSNRERVGRAFELLAAGLGPFVERQLKTSGGQGLLGGLRGPGEEGSLQDPAFLLRAMTEAWDSAFRQRLTKADRNLVFELRDTRNKWAHNEAFNADDTYRALDSVERLLMAVDAREAGEVGRSKTELRRLLHESETRKAVAAAPGTSGAVAGLRPWREVIVPHDDVAAGRYDLAEFAADLHQVATKAENTASEYADPVEFYRRTYLTEGLSQLLVEAAKRLSGTGGVPVVDLQTTFGGGKTHTLIALWHLCSGLPLEAFPQELQDLLRGAGVNDLPAVSRAALVGTKIAPGQPDKKDGIEVSTLWGELAWQLLGKDGYALVEGADKSGTSPGAALAELFVACSPCLVLIDEWVAYARQLYGADGRLAGGTFDAHVSFAQALTEASRATPGALLVVSLPASVNPDAEGETGSGSSSIELGGPGGAEALRRLRAVMGRIESSWRPASVEEGFEIVRRRLFQPLDPARLADRDATARAFTDYYRSQAAEFPNECRAPDYERRLRAAYPVHPELFDRLYRDWSSLERFQRTRGVLRLMAQVVGSLWNSQDRSPLVLPGSVPLDDAAVATELARNLDDSWKAVMDADVDGAGSVPDQLDALFQNLGRYRAAHKVARTVFLGSAPSVHSPHRGVVAARVRLGCAAPGEAVATYADALARLTDKAGYLYLEGERYWYGLTQSVSRVARERAERLMAGDPAELDQRICAAVRGQRERGDLAGVHVAPPSSADVDDDDRVRLVVLSPGDAYVPKSDDSPALSAARDILEHRGTSQRHYRNMVVFLAVDQRRLDDLRQGAAEALAWRWVVDEAPALDLGGQQEAQAAKKAEEADQTLVRRLGEAYTWALVPAQPDPTGPVVFDPMRVEGAGDLAARTARRLVEKGHLNPVYAPSVLKKVVLEGPLSALWERGHISVDELWDALARYPYLPRLKDREVLRRSVETGPAGFAWQAEGFALADGYDEASGRYLGLVVGPVSGASVSGATLLVRPELAMAQAEADRAAAAASAGVGADAGDGASPGPKSGAGVPPVPGTARTEPAKPRRFHGSVVLRSERLSLEFGRVVQEVVQRLADAGAGVEVTVEVSATSREGFEEPAVRTVTENARTLRFRDLGFEDE
jgi:predicted AAA+ superfamily ATPase